MDQRTSKPLFLSYTAPYDTWRAIFGRPSPPVKIPAECTVSTNLQAGAYTRTR